MHVVFPAFDKHCAHAHLCLTCHHLSIVWLQDILLHSPGANMLLHGTSVVKLSYLLKEDIPHEWTEHHDSQATLMAETQGWDIADTETMVFLVAPECPVSLYYQGWLTGLDRETALLVVPLCIVCAATFDTDFGHRATERFNTHMLVHGRPCHFQRMQFPKRSGSRMP